MHVTDSHQQQQHASLHAFSASALVFIYNSDHRSTRNQLELASQHAQLKASATCVHIPCGSSCSRGTVASAKRVGRGSTSFWSGPTSRSRSWTSTKHSVAIGMPTLRPARQLGRPPERPRARDSSLATCVAATVVAGAWREAPRRSRRGGLSLSPPMQHPNRELCLHKPGTQICKVNIATFLFMSVV